MDISYMRGTGVAIITPFHEDLSIDFEALGKLVKRISKTVDYLVVLGTTGESVTLSQAECQEVLDHVKTINAGKLPIVFGDFGGNNTAEVLARFDRYNLEGVSGLLAASPAYNKPTQEGIYQHYAALARKSPVPIIMYNVPGRTSSDMSAATIVRLAKAFENIVAVKDASSDFVKAAQIMRDKPKGFKLLSGDDATAMPLIGLGAEGVISVMANAIPEAFCSMIKAALEGDWDQAQVLNARLIFLDHPLYVEGNPGGIKAMLHLMQQIKNVFRLPLVPISAAATALLKAEMDEIQDLITAEM